METLQHGNCSCFFLHLLQPVSVCKIHVYMSKSGVRIRRALYIYVRDGGVVLKYFNCTVSVNSIASVKYSSTKWTSDVFSVSQKTMIYSLLSVHVCYYNRTAAYEKISCGRQISKNDSISFKCVERSFIKFCMIVCPMKGYSGNAQKSVRFCTGWFLLQLCADW